jgi:nucleoside transporter
MDAAPSSRSPALVTTQLSIMMFLEFFVWGAWYVTMNPFMQDKGMTPNQIGTAYSLGPLAAIVSPFFLGIIADRFFASERVLGILHLLGGLAILAAPAAAERSADAFLGVILLHMLCYMPTLGLTNTVAFHTMTRSERQFPLVRVFGTIGWIAANFVVSGIKADRSAEMFYVAGAAALLLGLYSFSLPHTPPPAKGKAFSLRDALGLDSLALMKSTSFAVFIICSFLICIPLAAYYSFANGFVGDVGFERIAFVMSFGQISEIFFMLIMPLLFARLGVKWMLLVGMLAWITRYGLFSAAADDKVRWMVLAGIILHGICYDFFFVTGQIYVDKSARPEIRAQAQGFLVLVTQGLGLGIGAKVIGAIVTANTPEAAPGAPVVRDWDTIWLIPCLAAAAIAVIFFLLFRNPRQSAGQPASA